MFFIIIETDPSKLVISEDYEDFLGQNPCLKRWGTKTVAEEHKNDLSLLEQEGESCEINEYDGV